MALNLKPGQIVISKQGKDTGLFYVFTGFEGNRAKLIRPERFNISSPKKKNPAHLQITNSIAGELVEYIKAGKDIDRGFFNRSLKLNGKFR